MTEYQNASLFRESQKYIPGGVNSPVRAFQAVSGEPVFVKRGQGGWVWDVEDRSYIDFLQSWGALILGHADPGLVEAVTAACLCGTSFGAATHQELELAQLIVTYMPSIEKLRMVNSGTEATMSAIRLARGYTKREKIIKFAGCYHGHADSFLIQAGSGALTGGIPNSKGVTHAQAQDTLIAQFNDLESVKALILEHKNTIAALILEAICGNMGCIPPSPDFLEGIEKLCAAEKIVFILDEVMTGFRVSRGGAQELYGIQPDLTCLGKIIGGGFPVGAFGGRADIMNHLAPLGEVYQAGTLSGNPVAMTAGIYTLKRLQDQAIYKALDSRAQFLELGVRDVLRTSSLKYAWNRVSSMFTVFFGVESVCDVQSAQASNTALFARFFQYMLSEGVYWPPSQFEVAFLSVAHTQYDLCATLEAFERSVCRLMKDLP